MPTPTRIEGDVYVVGNLSARSATLPDGTITNAMVAGSAAIEHTKLKPLTPVTVELFGLAAEVTAKTQVVHIARSAGTLVAIEAIVQTVASGADRTIDVDLQKSTGGGAYATVLTSSADFDDGSTARVPVAGVIDTASYVDGDSFAIVITVAGAAGDQADGLTVTLWLAESPN